MSLTKNLFSTSDKNLLGKSFYYTKFMMPFKEKEELGRKIEELKGKVLLHIEDKIIAIVSSDRLDVIKKCLEDNDCKKYKLVVIYDIENLKTVNLYDYENNDEEDENNSNNFNENNEKNFNDKNINNINHNDNNIENINDPILYIISIESKIFFNYLNIELKRIINIFIQNNKDPDLEELYKKGLPRTIDTSALIALNSKNFLPNKIYYHQFKKINSEIIQLTPNYNIEYDIPIYIPDIPKYSCFCALDEAREIKKYLKKKEMEKINNNNNINIINNNNLNNSEISINCAPVPNVKHNYCHICKKKYEEYLKHVRCNNHNDCLKKYKKEFNGIKETFKRIAIFYDGEKNFEDINNNNLINNQDLNDDDCKIKKKKRKKYKFKNNFIFKRNNKKLIKKENKINNNISLNENIKNISNDDNFDINDNDIKYEIYSNNYKDSNSEKFLNKKRYQTNNSSSSYNNSNNNKKKEKELNDKSLADNININENNNNNIKKKNNNNNKNLLSFIPSKKKNKDSDFSTNPNSLLPAKKKSLILSELICSKKVCKIFQQTEETKCIKGKYFIKKRIDKKEFIFITDIINV